MDTDLTQKIRRMYAAIGAAEEVDLTKLKGTVIENKNVTGVFQDFRGGRSNEQLENDVFTLINNIAFLRDHLIKWHVAQGLGETEARVKVDSELDSRPSILIMRDLSNNEKHGYDASKRSFSGKHPKIVSVQRVLRMTTQPQKGSFVGMTLNRDGTPRIMGDGSAKAVTTGEIVDNSGNRLGDLNDLATEAVEGWEEIFREFALKIGS
ncbi:MAG: hypothetical protein O2909_04655 [Chloroflexi bacterium]|nr:hypothetical protein [Chloroflexota bacterium]MDA1218714.1 hypothetical protein [Chloroflexota bacterium]PKB56873.1 MAG: hypothetical protein BZY73_06155 [SAR202 cluster bacterium Casp-Chloro-G3]